ncbi:hypothetical protein ACTOB_001197 [Actinoplanes oblitus]|uniref:Uncharacterized protein n=1 Tax=Actinoplanes oblitus TaxID=3040509 RepID=A0ABY8WPE3_9ACTN|nr:hypothetical protein [Actinoplanes oblitus]WIM97650.1 hypothetical protein ACTOB_001197 [Actinoplanes oblitus]
MSDRGPQNPPPAAPVPGLEPEPAAAEPIEIQDAPFNLLGDDIPEESEAAPPGPRRKRTRTVVLASLLAVGLAGAAALATFYWQIHSQRDTTLTLPAKIGDLTLDSGQNAQDTADYLRTALSAEVDLDETVGAVYTAAPERNVLFFGGTTLFWSPDKDLDTSFGLISDEQGAVTGLHEVDAGPLGGTMKCGTTKTETGDLSVCGWADHGSLALAMFPNRPESEAAPLMRQMRNAIQTRN